MLKGRIVAIKPLSQLQIDALRVTVTADDPKFATYTLGNAPAATRRLRALADASNEKATMPMPELQPRSLK